MTGRGPLRAGLAAVALLVGLLVGCGVPLDAEPRAIVRTTTTQTTVAPVEAGDDQLTVYYFRGERLEDVQVSAEADAGTSDAVRAVLRSPEPPLTTQIPTDTELLDFSLDGRTAVIDLSDEMEVVTGQRQKEAYAQLVFTALFSGEARSVRFLVAGEAIQAPTDQGNRDVVQASDFDPPLNPQ